VKSARILRQKIQSRQLTMGAMATNHFWIELVEVCKNAGLDYLIIDQEHNTFDGEKINDACALGRLIDFPIIVRPAETERGLIRKAADHGAAGFLLPTVESVEMMDAVRDALWMPPRGKRRPGGTGNRWVSDYNYKTWKEEVEDDFIVLPQIENQKGLSNVDAIARHEITTAIAIGPYDLSANLGVCWEPEHPKLQDAIGKIRKAGEDAGKTMWMIGDATKLIPRGFTFLCVAEPVWFLEAMLKKTVSELRAGVKGASGTMAKVD
jgi:2-keto-3-deoxy-L-rhamnonate aldolase RhmA